MDKLVTGIIKKSHGVKGFLRVRSMSGETEHFGKIKVVYIRTSEGEVRYRVEAVRFVSGHDVLLKLEGIDTPEYGKKFIGREILVERDKAAPLKENEYYIADLCKCNIYFKGVLIGRVKSVVEGGNAEYLEIVRENGTTFIVPFNNHFIEDVEIEGRAIILKEEYDFS